MKRIMGAVRAKKYWLMFVHKPKQKIEFIAYIRIAAKSAVWFPDQVKHGSVTMLNQLSKRA